LDQIEQRDAGLCVVAGDRHHEPEIPLDQPPLGLLVTLVLALGELALLRRRQQAAVADLTDVELEWVLDGRRGVENVDMLLLGLRRVESRDELELRLFFLEHSVVRGRLHHHTKYRHLPAFRLPQSGDAVRHPEPPEAYLRWTGMCGIAGYSLGPSSEIDRTRAAQALLAGIAERGADAVGYAHRSPEAGIVVHKQRPESR